MAKARMNVFTELSGSVGEDLTFRRLSMQNKQLLQTKPVPRYTRTTAQNAVRTGYKQACTLWKQANWLDKSVYTDFSKIYNITDFNTFLKLNLPVLTKSPALYFGLDEGTGTVAHDYSGNANNGQIVGATWQTLSTGKHVLSFDGVDDYIEVDNANFLPQEATQERTYLVWVYLESVELGYGRLFSFDDGAALGAGLEFGIAITTNELAYYDGTWYIGGENATIELNKWTLCGLIYDGEEIKLTKNDKICYENTSAGRANTTKVTIANRADYYNEGIGGKIALPAIFNKALTETQIQKIYKATRDLFNE